MPTDFLCWIRLITFVSLQPLSLFYDSQIKFGSRRATLSPTWSPCLRLSSSQFDVVVSDTVCLVFETVKSQSFHRQLCPSTRLCATSFVYLDEFIWCDVSNTRSRIFFCLKFFVGHESFLWVHWYPCFGLLVMSALGFKTRVDPSLVCLLACTQWIPQIHFWWDNCWPLDGQHGNKSHSLHATYVAKVRCQDSIGRPRTVSRRSIHSTTATDLSEVDFVMTFHRTNGISSFISTCKFMQTYFTDENLMGVLHQLSYNRIKIQSSHCCEIETKRSVEIVDLAKGMMKKLKWLRTYMANVLPPWTCW